jgi:hypothetical protein
MTLCRGQSACMTTGGGGDPAKHSARKDVREQLTAFEDDELRNWLMECIVNGSENFLCAVAEAAVAANAEDYLVIRPALLALRRKHNAKHAI